MTTQEFISKNIGLKPSKEKRCSSVFQGTNGNFYSYGYHYPLLFKVNGKWYRNTSGYSSSTGKHISWAYQPDCLDVKLTRFLQCGAFSSYSLDIKHIKLALKNEIKELKTNLKALSKRAWRQRENLEHELDQVKTTLSKI